MGWLRKLMGEAAPPVRSFGILARALLAERVWPEGGRPQARSLEALLGKLDRNQELGWLVERPEIERALAKVLGCSPEDVHAAVARGEPESSAREGRVRLEALRYGRALELGAEPLFPGLPPIVLTPSRWGRLWWHAAPGAGKSLVGQWLVARSLAVHLDAANGTHGLERAGAVLPQYVELARGASAPVLLAAPLCVAAPFPPTSGDFTLVESPRVEDFLPQLVAWVAARLPVDGGFDVDAALEWLHGGPVPTGVADTVGTVVGLCGALDEVGFRNGLRCSTWELTRRFVQHRIGELAARGHADVAWLRRSGDSVLLGLVTRLLTDTRGAWHDARDLDAWLALVPEEYEREIDVEWLQAQLASAAGPIRSRDIERAARRLSPGAFRVVRALSAAGLLRAVPGTSELTLRPLWLGRALVNEAERRLAQGSPVACGAALLGPSSAENLVAHLVRRLARSDHGVLEDVLELEAESSAEATAALEAVYRAAGFALLGGAELGGEALEALHAEQRRLAVVLEDGLPRPRIAHRVGPGSLLSDASFWLAVLAVSESVTGPRRGPPLLDAWRAAAPPPGLQALLTAIASELAHHPEALAIEVFALVDRLRRGLGQVGETPHPLELPGLALDEIALGVPNPATLAGVANVPHAPGALRALAARRGLQWREVAAAIWSASLATGDPLAAAPLVAAGSPLGPELWAHAPTAVWRELVARDEPGLRFADAGPETLLAATAASGAAVHEAFWATAPVGALESALPAHPPRTPAAAEQAWQRVPAALAAALATLVTTPNAAGAPLAASPPERTVEITAALAEVRSDAITDDAMSALRSWAHARVAGRAPDFLDAFALLARLERSLAKVTRP